MSSKRTPNTIMEKTNHLIAYVRKHAPVKFGKVCVDMHMAPSTLFNYIRIMTDVCDDITYEGGKFFVELHHRMPNGKLVPSEK